MKILGIDTSTEICALGLLVEGEMLAEINLKLDRRHSERLMPNLVHLFQESGLEIKEIEGMAVTIGPGSFTGLRIGLSTVKAMAQYLQVPVRGVSTLEVLAQGCTGCQGLLVPVLDARRQRVYTALFRSKHSRPQMSSLRRIWKDQALPVSELIGQLERLDDSRTIYVTGNGIASYGEMFVESGLNAVFMPP
ncbi:MAG: tRNA (adenosine(37)-N6)-threonylcarbamoyltransferase complex dimerization subunit type 1 TsaB, partial [Bacillota bacterium]